MDINIVNLPPAAKEIITEKLSEVALWLIGNGNPKSSDCINDIIIYMNKTTPAADEIAAFMNKARHRLDMYDISSNLDWKTVLPELAAVLKDY